MTAGQENEAERLFYLHYFAGDCISVPKRQKD